MTAMKASTASDVLRMSIGALTTTGATSSPELPSEFDTAGIA